MPRPPSRTRLASSSRGFSQLGTPLSPGSQGCSAPGGQALGACAVMPCSAWMCTQTGCVYSPAGVCAVRGLSRCGDPGSPGRVSLAHTGELLRARWCSFRRGAPADAGAAGPSLSALPPRGAPPVPATPLHPPLPAPHPPSPSSSLPPGPPAPPPRPRVLCLSNLHKPPLSLFVPGKAICQQCGLSGLPWGVNTRVPVCLLVCCVHSCACTCVCCVHVLCAHL